MSTILKTSELLKKIADPNTKIIDIRSVDAYNGWRLQMETRGGHIQSAKSLPFKWTKYIDWMDIVKSKNIFPENEIIIYGYHIDEIEMVKNHFSRAHYNHVHLYHDFVSEWCTHPNLPISKMNRYRNLVSPQWLNTLITTGNAPELVNKNYVVVHAYYRDKASYNDGHIPGAIAIDTNSFESQENWNIRTPNELKTALEGAGITDTTTVILYGKFSSPDINDPFPGSSAGHLGAMRCAFIMLYAGVKDIRILNGGLQSWIDEGFDISTEISKEKPVSNFGVKIPQHPELVVDISGAKDILRSKNNLVCVRSWREYIGETSGYNYIHKKGRIPGAVFANCGSDAYHMENYRNVDHTTREYHEIETLWAAINVNPQRHNSFYCGTGWRASEAFINAWLMGWSDISVFDGGWFEWSSDDNNPYETGIPSKLPS